MYAAGRPFTVDCTFGLSYIQSTEKRILDDAQAPFVELEKAMNDPECREVELRYGFLSASKGPASTLLACKLSFLSPIQLPGDDEGMQWAFVGKLPQFAGKPVRYVIHEVFMHSFCNLVDLGYVVEGSIECWIAEPKDFVHDFALFGQRDCGKGAVARGLG